MSNPRLYSTAEIAQRCALTRAAIHARYHKHGVGRMIGGSLVFTQDEMLEMLDWPRRRGRPPVKKEGA